MQYSLSYCDITQITEKVFEAVCKEGVVCLDKKCADETWDFWNELRKEPFGMLVNSKITITHSFEGARDIGLHQLQKKTALLVFTEKQENEFKMALQIKQVTGDVTQHKIFRDRDEAIAWLDDLNS